MLRALHKYDAFPKVERNIQHATRTGGLLTLAVAVGLALLVYSEFAQYIHVRQSYEFLVDQKTDNQLQINIDITIAMKCS
ncbi:Endoplasmic reticulum-Golgi intermediate compartment protein 2, partial [Cladochytrium tenue]